MEINFGIHGCGRVSEYLRVVNGDTRNNVDRSDVQRNYASLLESQGRLPEAIAAQTKAAEVDPLSSRTQRAFMPCVTQPLDSG